MYYFTDLDIPYEVVVFLLKKEVWNKYFNDGSNDSFKTLVISKDKATKPKVAKTIENIITMNQRFSDSSYKIKEEDIYTKIIRNTEFNLSLTQEPEKLYLNGDYCVCMNISTPSIKMPYKMSMPLRSGNFIDLLNECSYISNKEIHGNYVYMNNQMFYRYSPENENLIDNLERVATLKENKKTTALIPGHVYLMKDKRKILYLGDLKESREERGYNWKYERGHSFFSTSFQNVFYPTYYSSLYVDLDDIKRLSCLGNINLSEFVNLNKGSSINEFLPAWVEYFETTNYSKSECLDYTCIVSMGGGVDLGEYLVNDSPELCEILGDICLDRLNSMLGKEKIDSDEIITYSLALGSRRLIELPDETKDKLAKIIVKPELDRMFKSVAYNVKPELYTLVLNENTSTKNIYNHLKSLGNYRINMLNQVLNYPSSFLGLLFKDRQTELDSLIIESKKANFKK